MRDQSQIFPEAAAGEGLEHHANGMRARADLHAVALACIDEPAPLPEVLRARIAFDDAEPQPLRAVLLRPALEMLEESRRDAGAMQSRRDDE